jgi:hypothetical protein
MRTVPNRREISDIEEINKLQAKPWQIDLLNKNPEYVFWGNYEDGMSSTDKGWGSPQELDSFSQRWGLDELNELVNFYFEVYRKNHQCPHCEGAGINPETKEISDNWYGFNNIGRKWCDKITDDEVYELLKCSRLNEFTDYRGFYYKDLNVWMSWVGGQKVQIDPPTPEQIPSAKEVNDAQNNRKRGFIGHDAINRWICIEQRAKRLGVYGKCEHCVDGRIYDEPEARVALQLWFIHPRKGASRGVYIKNIKEKEVPEVIAYLKEAAERNANRFSKL